MSKLGVVTVNPTEPWNIAVQPDHTKHYRWFLSNRNKWELDPWRPAGYPGS